MEAELLNLVPFRRTLLRSGLPERVDSVGKIRDEAALFAIDNCP